MQEPWFYQGFQGSCGGLGRVGNKGLLFICVKKHNNNGGGFINITSFLCL
jgi:hypothetical protein